MRRFPLWLHFNMKSFTRIVSFSTCLLIFTFAEQNLLQNAFSQVPNMNNIIPDTDPLFEEKVSLLQCMSLCVTLLPCLSVFVAKRGSCRGYQLSHRHLNGVGFLSAEGETYYYKGELFGKNDFHLTLIDNLKSHFYYWSIIWLNSLRIFHNKIIVFLARHRIGNTFC